MPSSARRARRGRRDARRDKDDLHLVDLEEPSPSRPAKRRRRTRSSDPVTQQLKSRVVQASKDHANAIHEANRDGVKAYAKVAAQDWTFYITKLAVNIGRGSEVSHGDDQADFGAHVHIDLGPSKMVSRDHASICFDSKDEEWILEIKGRNGAKIDGRPLKSRASHRLVSGEVIEIGNVEMMFVLPSEISPLHVNAAFLQRCGLTPEAVQAPISRRQPPITPASAEYKGPGTPPPVQSRGASSAKSPAVATPAVMIGAHGVDLSQDDNQHIKPQYSYAQMITQAILNAPDERLNLNGIYTFITDSYSYYRHQQAAGWQNSIRHNLSLNKSFDKVARSTDEPGKGMKWQIVPEAMEEMVKNAFKIGRGGHRGSSAPSSPNQLNYITQGARDMATRQQISARRRLVSPVVSPPNPLSVTATHSTPQQRSEPPGGRNATSTVDGSPLPRHRKSNRR
ncbi:hypothetical protein UVI_02034500 [Ustilaginoidea virens]|uniref:FKH1-like protein n=1 Tax=Ustilaginoidea virens TaxID=1159556 RepID=A0A1B5L8Q0_USTVR|nr:hypothetical protein UVI_02034500 [Ustilaginoidea virens]